MTSDVNWKAASAALVLSLGCAGSRSHADGPAPAAAMAVADAGPQAGDGLASPKGSASSSATPAPAVERPFAKTPLEAQSMIQEQIESRVTVLWKCVDAYRAKKGDAHKLVIADIGIDQEGNLVGVVAPNAKQGAELEPTLRTCLTDALRGLAFPRSHAGVITVRQSFKDAPVPQ
jgi:hypothetical protein